MQVLVLQAVVSFWLWQFIWSSAGGELCAKAIFCKKSIFKKKVLAIIRFCARMCGVWMQK